MNNNEYVNQMLQAIMNNNRVVGMDYNVRHDDYNRTMYVDVNLCLATPIDQIHLTLEPIQKAQNHFMGHEELFKV